MEAGAVQQECSAHADELSPLCAVQAGSPTHMRILSAGEAPSVTEELN